MINMSEAVMRKTDTEITCVRQKPFQQENKVYSKKII